MEHKSLAQGTTTKAGPKRVVLEPKTTPHSQQHLRAASEPHLAVHSSAASALPIYEHSGFPTLICLLDPSTPRPVSRLDTLICGSPSPHRPSPPDETLLSANFGFFSTVAIRRLDKYRTQRRRPCNCTSHPVLPRESLPTAPASSSTSGLGVFRFQFLLNCPATLAPEIDSPSTRSARRRTPSPRPSDSADEIPRPPVPVTSGPGEIAVPTGTRDRIFLTRTGINNN